MALGHNIHHHLVVEIRTLTYRLTDVHPELVSSVIPPQLEDDIIIMSLQH